MASSFPKHVKLCSLTAFEKGHKISNGVVSIGFDVQPAVINFISSVLNFTYSFLLPDDMNIGQPLENGSWTGMIGLLQRGECDLSFSSNALTEERSGAVHYNYPHYISSVTFLTQKPQPLPKNFAIFYPFSKTLWSTLIIFVLGYSLLFTKIHFGKCQHVRILFLTLGNVFGQPFTIEMTSSKRKLIFGCWILGISILVHSYKATLLSYLIITPVKGISTIVELAAAVEDGSVASVTYKGSYFINELLGSNDESTRTIGRSALENSQLYITKPEVVLNGTRNAAFISPDFLNRHLRFQYFQSKDSFFPVFVAFPIRKDFCCKAVFHRTVRRMMEAGFYEQILRDIESRYFIDNASKYPTTDKGEQKLALEDIEGAVAILICGHILSFAVFIAEKLFHRIYKT